MKKFLLAALLVPTIAFAQTYPSPTFSGLTLQNPLTAANGGTGSTTSTGTGAAVLSNSPALTTPNLGTPSAVTLTNGTGLPISTGVSGLGTGVATGLANAVTGSGSPVLATSPSISGLTVTGSLTATGLIAPGALAAQSANTILANATSSSASPTAFSVPSCSTASSALTWVSGSGAACNTAINASTLGGATFGAPGPVGSTTASTGAFTALSASSTVSGAGFSTYLASPPAIGGTTAAAGSFTALSASTNNPTFNYLSALTGASARTYTAKLSDWSSVMDFGAVGNGIANDGPVISVAAAAGPVIIPPGTYLISSSITLSNAVQFLPGAKFVIASGQTVTFNGPLVAGVQQIFSGAGATGVSISAAYTPIGYPEWWGAVIGNTGFDDSTPINECIVAMPVCRLQAGIYYTTGSILIQTAGRALIGPAPGFSGSPGTAVITNQSATATIVQMGPNSYPGSFQNTNILKDLAITRNVGPQIGAQANGVLIQYTIFASVENVLVQDSGIGFHIKGTNQTRMTRDYAYRVTAGTGSGTDQFYGFWIDGNANIGGAGGNESVYMDNCTVSSGVTWSSSIDYQGFVASGTYGYSDIFVKNFETAGLGIGVDLQGNSATGSTVDIQNEDVRFYNIVSDSNYIAGILIANTSIYGSIQFIGGYINFAGNSTPVGLSMSGSNGSVIFTGFQIGCFGVASAEGMYIQSSRGINSFGNNIFECKNIPVTLVGVTHSRFADQIRAFGQGSTTQPAVYIHGSSIRNQFNEMVEGASTAYSQGYYLGDATTTFSEFNASGIDPAAISGSKLNNNGTGITAVGTFGTSNYATGVMN